jgi:CubicO group peptidase (beta-lactamase class C family)
LGNTYGNIPYETEELQITVDHLVEHTAGFANEPTDIMFEPVNLNFNSLAGKVLDERSLTFEPGLRFQYSNFGYALLGKIIEAKSGQSYKDYVKENILEPNLINDVYMGKSTIEEKLPNETMYYSTWASPYSMNLERLDAAGGWVSNAKSLALLAVKSDGRFNVNNILPEGAGVSYLSRSSWTHNGALPGTLAVLRVGHPFSYVVIVNSGESNFAIVLDAIHTFMNNMIERQDAWPNTDLFEPSQ